MEAIADRLQEFGITLDVGTSPLVESDAGFDALVTLVGHGNHARYALNMKTSMTLTAVLPISQAAWMPHPLLVVGPKINGRSAAAFRAADIQYIDTIGNAFIKFGSVYVEVQGRTTPTLNLSSEWDFPTGDHRDYQEVSPRRVTRNLFSPRRSQVVLALLAWPNLAEAKVRDIAQVAGVSVGQAHESLALLEDAGFLKGERLHRFSELLDYWTNEYPRGLGRKMTIATFASDSPDNFRPLYPDQAVYFSGESARGVDIVRPTTLTIYVETFDKKIALVNRWRADSSGGANIVVMKKFWTDPTYLTRPDYRGEDVLAGPDNAPWPLVYADLMASGDPRLAEVARTWRNDRSAESGQM
ncbi:type IV toxin-antitoxin system AbiEi family antitoxin [Rhodococcus sp. UFZ-B548]|uniref:type IV toxin-antitoxin system AbiEi family antitoxin n=1 Tax=Rhodococcus sp. UFZ-B548 TaxID=2742212 RepID=UPI0015F3817F|nr:type IV toxin-antitoxin system AbiEi family antitoxin [Rhodococcus sp. UFZ-B548]